MTEENASVFAEHRGALENDLSLLFAWPVGQKKHRAHLPKDRGLRGKRSTQSIFMHAAVSSSALTDEATLELPSTEPATLSPQQATRQSPVRQQPAPSVQKQQDPPSPCGALHQLGGFCRALDSHCSVPKPWVGALKSTDQNVGRREAGALSRGAGRVSRDGGD